MCNWSVCKCEGGRPKARRSFLPPPRGQANGILRLGVRFGFLQFVEGGFKRNMSQRKEKFRNMRPCTDPPIRTPKGYVGKSISPPVLARHGGVLYGCSNPCLPGEGKLDGRK